MYRRVLEADEIDHRMAVNISKKWIYLNLYLDKVYNVHYNISIR